MHPQNRTASGCVPREQAMKPARMRRIDSEADQHVAQFGRPANIGTKMEVADETGRSDWI
jgi:hypothetical protein